MLKQLSEEMRPGVCDPTQEVQRLGKRLFEPTKGNFFKV